MLFVNKSGQQSSLRAARHKVIFFNYLDAGLNRNLPTIVCRTRALIIRHKRPTYAKDASASMKSFHVAAGKGTESCIR